MYSKRAAASSQVEAEPPRMDSQPPGWEPVRAKLIALVPFGYEAYSICILAFFVAPQGS